MERIKNMPLICQAGSAAEAFAGSLRLVKNNVTIACFYTGCQSYFAPDRKNLKCQEKINT